MSATFQQEFLLHIYHEMEDLLEEDYKEVGHNGYTFNPDWDSYLALETQGMLKVFTARVDNILVGYFVTMIFPSFQSKGNTVVANEAIFVTKEYRKSRIGVGLFKFTEKCLKEDGHKTLIVTTTEANPIDNLLQRMGYYKIETRFEKVI